MNSSYYKFAGVYWYGDAKQVEVFINIYGQPFLDYGVLTSKEVFQHLEKHQYKIGDRVEIRCCNPFRKGGISHDIPIGEKVVITKIEEVSPVYYGLKYFTSAGYWVRHEEISPVNQKKVRFKDLPADEMKKKVDELSKVSNFVYFGTQFDMDVN